MTGRTKVYGTSDDLIEFEGEFTGEVCCYGSEEHPVLIVMSDGTILEVSYSKNIPGVWAITLLRRGPRFERIDQCADVEANPYSDVVHFSSGIEWAYAAREWEVVS